MLRRLNYPLILGGAIIFMLLFIIMFEFQILPIDPYAIDLGAPKYENGDFIVKTPPLSPNDVNIFGTDILGRDIFSQIIAGARITLRIGLFITLFRFVIALPLAFLAGFGEKISTGIINFFNKTFTAIPALIVSIIILNLDRLKALELNQSIVVFTIVLTFVGWGRLANVLKQRVQDILNEDFIQGEIAIGKNKFLIAIQNVLPHLTASMIVYSFLEMGNALLMLAQLGVFGVYVGVSKINPETLSELGLSITPNYNPEWGAMLGSAKYSIIAMKPWVALFPALAFFVSIIGFNLLGEGLQYEISKRNSMVITWIKRFAFHLSPKTYLYEIKNINRYKRNFTIKTAIILLIVLIPLIPVAKSPYELEAIAIFNHVEELAKDDYEGRLVTTEGRDKAADYIINQLKDVGLKPIFSENEYVYKFDKKDPFAIVKDSQLVVENKSGNKIREFKFRKEFNYNSIRYEAEGGISEAMRNTSIVDEYKGTIITEEEYWALKEEDHKGTYFVLVNPDRANYNDILTRAINDKAISVLLWPDDDASTLEGKNLTDISLVSSSRSYFYDRYRIVYVTKDVAQELEDLSGSNIVLNTDAELLEGIDIKNIGAKIEGKSSENPLVVYTSYDYVGYDRGGQYKGLYENGTSIGAILEMAKKLASIEEQPERTIVFAFLDSSKYKGEGAQRFTISDYMNEDTFYIDLSYLGLTDSETLYLDTSQTASDNKEGFEHVKYFKKRGRELGIDIQQEALSLRDDASKHFFMDGASGIIVRELNMDQTYQTTGTMQNDLNRIDTSKTKLHSQLVLDTIVRIAYKGE